MNEKLLSSDLLRGHTDTIILKLLDSGDKYGYQISKLINELSDHKYELKEATMYSSIKRLEAGGFITSYWGAELSTARRKYYKITDHGRALYWQNKAAWESAKIIIDKLI